MSSNIGQGKNLVKDAPLSTRKQRQWVCLGPEAIVCTTANCLMSIIQRQSEKYYTS